MTDLSIRDYRIANFTKKVWCERTVKDKSAVEIEETSREILRIQVVSRCICFFPFSSIFQRDAWYYQTIAIDRFEN